MSPTACGCGGKKREAAAVKEPKTTGAWKLTSATGEVSFHDVKVAAQAQDFRNGGGGVIERNK